MKTRGIAGKLFIMAASILGMMMATLFLVSLLNRGLVESIHIVEADVRRDNLVGDIKEQFDKARIALAAFQGSGAEDDAERVDQALNRIPPLADTLLALEMPEEMRAELDVAVADMQAYAAMFAGIRPANSMVRINAFRTDFEPMGTRIEGELDYLQEINREDARRQFSEQVAMAEAAPRWMLGLSALALAVSGIMALLMGRSLSRPVEAIATAIGRVRDGVFDGDLPGLRRRDEIGEISRALGDLRDRLREDHERRAGDDRQVARQRALFREVSQRMEAMATGDLGGRMDEAEFADLEAEHQQLCRDLNGLTDGLQSVLNAVNTSSGQVSDGASRISRVALDMSRRAEKQAATLEESAAALELQTKSLRGSAENAAQARSFVDQNLKDVEDSGDGIKKAMQAMALIEESSGRINQIVNVIDDIAFQTNLLAMNAGVEAARAGEEGRGFAVVASEVRALARRASKSTHDIKELIAESNARIGEGSKRVEGTGAALVQIVESVGRISDLVAEISSATEEQATGLNEINSKIGALDQFTQQTAALAEETHASSEVLDAEAEKLAGVLARFRAGEAGGDDIARFVRSPDPADDLQAWQGDTRRTA